MWFFTAIESLMLAFAQFMEREAGHTIISLVLIVFGVDMLSPEARAAVARDIVVFSLGVMSRSMGNKKEPAV